MHTVKGVFIGTLMVLYGAFGSEASMNFSYTFSDIQIIKLYSKQI